jgi:hypothetical protein
MTDSVKEEDLDGAGSQNPTIVDRKPYDPAEDRERLRGYLAIGLTALFSLVVLALLASAIRGWLSDDQLEKLAGILISPVAALLGAVVGFYYGEQSRARS